MKAQAIVVQMVSGQTVSSVVPVDADLVLVMKARGFELTGFVTATRTRADGVVVPRAIRPELVGAPIFSGLVGPCWGGDKCPLRYEDSRVNELMSM
jgi:hypothetical protein